MSGYATPKSGKQKKGSCRKNKAEQISRPWEDIGREGLGPLKGPIVKRLGVSPLLVRARLCLYPASASTRNAITGIVIYTLTNEPF